MPAPVQIARQDVAVTGGALASFRLNDPSLPNRALAVHGITANSRSWLPVARALASEAGFTALDLRGRGASSGLPGPYGFETHLQDLLAVLDRLELERPLLIGHSLGAYLITRFAVQYPERVGSLVLVDGGLPIPGTENVDPQVLVDATIGPAIARLKLTFASNADYYAWWRKHPALGGDEVADQDLAAYADHDLTGAPPDLHSSVNEAAIRADAADVLASAPAAHELTASAQLLCAPLGFVNDPNPLQPIALAQQWASAAPQARSVKLVPGVNHYTITLGAPGAAAVADAIRRALGSTDAAG